MANKQICSVDVVDSVTDEDKILVNVDGKLRQIKVSELNSNLDGLGYGENAGGKNLIDISKITDNSYVQSSDGMFLTYSNVCRTDYIEVKEGQSVYFSGMKKPNIGNTGAMYDENKNYVGAINNYSDVQPLVIPQGVKYIALSIWKSLFDDFTKAQLEEGIYKTEYKQYIPSVKMLAEEVSKQNKSLGALGKCKNLLNPTLQTTTQNGVTCTNNGDGTYTLNGTVDSGKYPEFPLGMITLDKGKYLFPNQNSSAYLWCGTSKASNNIVNSQLLSNIFINIENKNDIYITLVCQSGRTYDNVVIKPMITTDLSATYDDFVPYTGDGDTLTDDVAELKNDLGGLSFSVSGSTLSITDGTNTWTLGANS